MLYASFNYLHLTSFLLFQEPCFHLISKRPRKSFSRILRRADVALTQSIMATIYVALAFVLPLCSIAYAYPAYLSDYEIVTDMKIHIPSTVHLKDTNESMSFTVQDPNPLANNPTTCYGSWPKGSNLYPTGSYVCSISSPSYTGSDKKCAGSLQQRVRMELCLSGLQWPPQLHAPDRARLRRPFVSHSSGSIIYS